jgi:hypothetical protein
MGTLRPRLDETTFRCDACEFTWDAPPARVDDDPSTPWHPWSYFAACPVCRSEVPQQPQARHMLKMWAKASGPRTPEGKAAVTKNLEGHPTPEETARTRFNAMKHGLRAEVATYFPAKPGGYPHCNGCEYLFTTCASSTACQKRTELYLRHRIAFDTRDPTMLTDLRADLHSTVHAILSDMLLAVVQDGARLKTPEWFYDKDGGFHLAQHDDGRGNKVQIFKLEEHPLLKRIGEFISRIGLDLNSQGMTPKVQEDADVIRGHLDDESDRSELSLEYQRRQTEMLEKLGGMIETSRANAAKDPVLLERKVEEAKNA